MNLLISTLVTSSKYSDFTKNDNSTKKDKS